LIYLDTHVVVWLYEGRGELFCDLAKRLVRQNSRLISPIVQLELSYLCEVGKLKAKPKHIIEDLQHRMGLQFCGKSFQSVVEQAMKTTWTRDPFDRLIVAQAATDGSKLLTRDRTIIEHYTEAVSC